MNFKSWIHYFGKIPLCGIAYFIGFMVGSPLASALGLTAPALPAGSDATTLMQLTLVGSLILALVMAWLSRNLGGGFFVRWISLFILAWITYALNTYFEAAIFSTMAAASTYTLVIYTPAFLLQTALVAALFPPDARGESFVVRAKGFFAGQNIWILILRLVAAYLAFPAAYLLFGTLIAPIVMPYYQQGVAELSLPGWDQILPVLALRSLFFVLACLPVLIAWQGPRLRLFVVLGLALFAFVGGVAMLQAHWFPPIIRTIHSLEIFADEMVYAGALVLLLTKSKTEQATTGSAVTPKLVEVRK